MSAEAYDYIVVGAGSAGCVVASRLSEASHSTVALIEAGGEDRNFWINVPLGFGKLYNEPSINWNYESEPEAGLNGVKSYQPRGKVIGGTGSINGMVYMRAAPEEYDEWRDLGNPGWGFEDVLPYFKKSERNERGESKFHGASGPLNVTNGQAHELGSAFMSAARECGFAVTQDHCGEHHEGFGVPQYNIKNGRRNSTAKAFLQPARQRSNLNVITDSIVNRIVMENGAAVGVEIIRDGKPDLIRARCEVVLCAGVFNTPQLLQVSGLGPGAVLQDAGVGVLKDIPGIGADLEDHFGVNLAFSCRAPITITDALSHPVKRLLMGLQYFVTRGGHLATPGTYCTGFFRSTPDSGRVDSHISIAGWARSGPGKASNSFGLLPYPAYSLIASILRPYSRGSVRITSGDARIMPSIRFNFLEDRRDQELLVQIIRIARELANSSAMNPYTQDEVLPGAEAESDTDLLNFCRSHGRSTHHGGGSCKMGLNKPVDSELRLRSVGRLRIADASVMPAMIAGNINATVIMIAERAAAMMLQDAKPN